MWRGRPHDDGDIGGSHSTGDRDDQGRFGMKIEMSVVDRFLWAPFRVFSPRRIAWGLWGRGGIFSTYISVCFWRRVITGYIGLINLADH